MYPVHDVDAILLLAMSLAAKRRPAELVEIIAAADLAQGVIPLEGKLIESFYRLSAYGLICELDGGYTLTADAQQIMTTGQRKKAVPEKRIFSIKENLADYHLNGEHAAILVTEEQISAAVAAHKAAKITMGRSWLVPKPKPVEDNNKRPGSRKPFPFRSNKK
jgi:predicted transcriptional regulator